LKHAAAAAETVYRSTVAVFTIIAACRNFHQLISDGERTAAVANFSDKCKTNREDDDDDDVVGRSVVRRIKQAFVSGRAGGRTGDSGAVELYAHNGGAPSAATAAAAICDC